jgi:hypothetical protein
MERNKEFSPVSRVEVESENDTKQLSDSSNFRIMS